IERNRCVQCLRCVRGITTSDGKRIFGMVNRGGHVEITVDKELAANITDDMAKKAMDLCPVGAILKKEVGFAIPIGKRKFDAKPIGSEIEKM
ncbi:MAG TPA: ferredoxin, partial [Spirochaetota bacterium]|nr:ferredoxin [Spirochaetota bacterium]